MYKSVIVAGVCCLFLGLFNPLQAHECRELEPGEYQKTIFEYIDQGVKGIKKDLFERYIQYQTGPLSTEKFSGEELRLLNLMGLTYMTSSQKPVNGANNKNYFSLGDTLESAIYKLSGEGDESDEVSSLLEDLLACYELFDGFNLMPRISPLIYLNTYRIQGERILGLYRDICDRSQLCVLGVLYLVNLGELSSEELNRQIDMGEMSKAVKRDFRQVGQQIKTIVVNVRNGKVVPGSSVGLLE